MYFYPEDQAALVTLPLDSGIGRMKVMDRGYGKY